jgi:WD40 repeat protein
MNKNFRFFLVLLAGLMLSAAQAQTLVWAKDAHPDGLQVNGVAFSPDGSLVLAGTNCHPAKIRLFSTADGSVVWDYTVSQSLECMMGVGMSANSRFIATAEETGNLMLFDYTQSPPVLVKTIDLSTSYAFAVDFAPNSGKVAVGTSGGKLKTFRLPDGTADLNVAAHGTSWVTTLRYSPDNTRIATGGSDNKVKIWDTTGVLLHTLPGHTDDITGVRFTPDNQRLVSSSDDNTIKIWNVATGALEHSIDGSTTGLNTVDVSPDGQYIVSATGGDMIKIWRMSDYSIVTEFSTDPYGTGVCVFWAPGAPQIACGTSSGKVLLFDVTEVVASTQLVYDGPVDVFPNPFSDVLTVKFPHADVQTISLFDPAGRLVSDAGRLQGIQQTELRIGQDRPAGNYLLRLTDVNGRVFATTVSKHR